MNGKKCKDCAKFVMLYEDEMVGSCNVKGGVSPNHSACDKFEKAADDDRKMKLSDYHPDTFNMKSVSIATVIQFLQDVRKKYGNLTLYIDNEECKKEPNRIQRDMLLRFMLDISKVKQSQKIPKIGSMQEEGDRK